MNNSLLKLKEPYDQRYINGSSHAASVSTEVVSFRVITSINCSPLFKTQNRIAKRLVDLLISTTAIVFLLSWLVPILAILIKIDSAGPVFFVQKRNKKDGRFFYCLKFRTMVVNTQSDTLTATVNDKRITSLGKFLRRSYIDELPQLINVLIGDMSIIGPRPHMSVENIKYSQLYTFYHKRHAVKPGITGLAQSLGYHGPMVKQGELEKKIEYDIHYINNWSIFLDMKILKDTAAIIYKKFAHPLKS
ncbi:exopolysaccharide biosynthesis protein [Pedobacter sp. LMG 31464]|uniref:Exopolysaccharide biosynthesis protein n=1 Tax=Pedobacter planticolens TaxID=2679964 RepID=A0A923DWZ6_9SPHI|nr:sugar transferase [Pedobacter planticolens]MBB2144640.1 exopolysaccharide biosynthesis protein [Pedobacter planticolens]